MDEGCYLGTILLWSIPWAPYNWAFCNGQLLPIGQYQALFSLISNIYGGDGSTNFALPDLRSRVPVGAYQSSNSSTPFTLTPVQFKQQGGSENTILPAHTHSASVTGSNINASLMVSSQPATINGGATAGSTIAQPGTVASRVSPFVGIGGFNTLAPDTAIQGLNITGGVASAVTIGQTGSGNGNYGNMQPFLGLNYIICISGLYPTRS